MSRYAPSLELTQVEARNGDIPVDYTQRDRYARQKKTALRGAHPARHPLPVQGHGEWPVPIARGIEHGTEDAARQDEGLPESQAVPGSPLPRGV
jgi:hypothetical protein